MNATKNQKYAEEIRRDDICSMLTMLTMLACSAAQKTKLRKTGAPNKTDAPYPVGRCVHLKASSSLVSCDWLATSRAARYGSGQSEGVIGLLTRSRRAPIQDGPKKPAASHSHRPHYDTTSHDDDLSSIYIFPRPPPARLSDFPDCTLLAHHTATMSSRKPMCVFCSCSLVRVTGL